MNEETNAPDQVESPRDREAKARAAYARLHAAASTTAAENEVNVLAGDLQALLNVIGAPPPEEPAEPVPPPDPNTPPAP